MTNNDTPKVTATVLPWNTDHLICKCGHAWGMHFKNAGCSIAFCNCAH